VQNPKHPGHSRQLIGLAILTGLILALFAIFVDLPAVVQQLRTAEARFFAAASLLFLAGLLAYAGRWRLLLANKPSLGHTFHASNVGHAGNILIPARAGEAARILVMSASDAVSITEATSSFVVERLLEQLMRLAALAGAIGFGVGITLSSGSILGGLSLLLLAFAAVAWLLRHQDSVLARGPAWLARLPRVTETRSRQTLADLLANLSAIARPSQLGLLLFYSSLTWACFWGFFYLTLLALAESVPSGQQLALSLAALALSPPSAPTQPGVFHASLVAPLAAVGYDAESVTAYAVLLHIQQMVWMIGLALWGLARIRLSPRALWLKAGF
jgi:hypothetical protein